MGVGKGKVTREKFRKRGRTVASAIRRLGVRNKE